MVIMSDGAVQILVRGKEVVDDFLTEMCLLEDKRIEMEKMNQTHVPGRVHLLLTSLEIQISMH